MTKKRRMTSVGIFHRYSPNGIWRRLPTVYGSRLPAYGAVDQNLVELQEIIFDDIIASGCGSSGVSYVIAGHIVALLQAV